MDTHTVVTKQHCKNYSPFMPHKLFQTYIYECLGPKYCPELNQQADKNLDTQDQINAQDQINNSSAKKQKSKPFNSLYFV